MKILALDSSAKTTSVALGDETRIIAEFSASVKLTHSQTLMPMMESLFSCTGIAPGDVDYFAVSAGPGSFTGLRIGIGAVKGLAYGSGKLCIPVSTLDALSRNLSGADGLICAAMDARCNQVYTALFDSTPGSICRMTEDSALLIDELEKLLEEQGKHKKKIFFVGDGADLCYNKLKDRVPNLFLASEPLRFQKASSVILAARDKLSADPGCAVSAAALAPVYLRLPQAQRELLAKEKAASEGAR